MKNIFAKILYGFLFAAVLPVLLVVWAARTDWVISLPVPEISYPGYILVFCGILLILAGILNLLFFGKGLPMNAFPPDQYVKKGIYSVMKHPVYTGAVLLCFGTSVVLQSSSGLWLISPCFTLMVIAYVAGLWAQIIEGSSKLLRPYGYCGGLIGGATGCLITALFFDRYIKLCSPFFHRPIINHRVETCN